MTNNRTAIAAGCYPTQRVDRWSEPAADIRLVLFDLDNTLYDHSYARDGCLLALRACFPLLARVPLAVLGRHYDDILTRVHDHVLGGRITPDEARQARLKELLADYGIVPDSRRFAAACRSWTQTYQERQRAVPGAKALIESLRSCGIAVGLITNGLTEIQQRKVEVCRLSGMFNPLLTSEAAGYRKPDRRIFELALQHAEMSAESAVMVGDSWQFDMVGARAAGLGCIWFNRDEMPLPETGVAVELNSFEPVEQARSAILEL